MKSNTREVKRGAVCQAAYIIHHEGSDSSANLIVGLGFAVRTQQDEEKPVRITGHLRQMEATTELTRDRTADAPCWDGDLGQASQRRGLSQTHKRDERLFQKIHLTNQNVGGFCVTRDLLHEFIFQLWERRAACVGGTLVDGRKSIVLATHTPSQSRTAPQFSIFLATLPPPYHRSTWQ